MTVASDTSKISSAIQQFVTDYNTVQSYISSQMAVTNNSDGTVTAGLLTGDMTANDIASSLRSTSFSGISISGSSNVISSLADLGITTNGKNNTVTLDSSTLNSVLAGNSERRPVVFHGFHERPRHTIEQTHLTTPSAVPTQQPLER